MDTTTLQAEVRKERGKGPARRLRAEGKLPAVLYGPGGAPALLTVSPKELTKALRAPHGRNTLFMLTHEGATELAMVKDLAVDPVSRAPLHVDFYRVSADRPLEVTVPFHTDGRPKGVVRGGVLHVTTRELPRRALPGRIPVEIRVDIRELDIHDHLSVAELSLPEGAVCTLPPKHTLVVVVEDKHAAAPGEAEEGAAAPAAEGAPAATPAG